MQIKKFVNRMGETFFETKLKGKCTWKQFKDEIDSILEHAGVSENTHVDLIAFGERGGLVDLYVNKGTFINSAEYHLQILDGGSPDDKRIYNFRKIID